MSSMHENETPVSSDLSDNNPNTYSDVWTVTVTFEDGHSYQGLCSAMYKFSEFVIAVRNAPENADRGDIKSVLFE